MARIPVPARFALLGALLLLLAFVGLCQGGLRVGAAEILRHWFVAPDPTVDLALRTFRVPRVLTAILGGGALAASGLLLQTWFRNPLADAHILGISSGAMAGVAFGTTAASAFGISFAGRLARFGTVCEAAAGAALACAALVLFARAVRGKTALLVAGVMLGYLCAAVVSTLLWCAGAEETRAFALWSMGSFSHVELRALPVAFLFAALGGALGFSATRELDALLLGDDGARSVGVDLNRARAKILGAAAILSGTVCAFCGPVGFVGLAVPHVARRVLGTVRHRALMPFCWLCGGVLGLAAMTASEASGGAVPLNAVTALLGAPVVLSVLVDGARRG